MKQKKCVFFIVSILLSLILSIQVYAVGDGNLDGGGGSMGQGTSQNSWSPGNEGVRVTVIRAESHDPVTRPIDLTNKHPNIAYSFGKVSKMSYTRGSALMIDTNPYEYVNPAQSLPRIISSKSLGQANIEQIKSYFTDEQVVRSIAGLTGMDFDTLVGGEYRLLLEPISFLKFQGALIAVTATEAALYDEMLSGGLRAVLPTVAFQNLPLSMFLETPDLGYPAWGGPTSGIRSNSEIKSSLGLGIVRFRDVPPEEPEITTYDYEYRTNTEVITAVEVSGGQSDPDHPVCHAHKRGTCQKGQPFKGNVEGCDPRYSFRWVGKSNTVYVFEAPIDMLSFISMYQKGWMDHSYVALCGVAEHALMQLLNDAPHISQIALCLDHDKAGIQARERIKKNLSERGYHMVFSLFSNLKDWNEDLQELKKPPPEYMNRQQTVIQMM